MKRLARSGTTDEHGLAATNVRASVFKGVCSRAVAGSLLMIVFGTTAYLLVGASLGLLLAGLLAAMVLAPLLDNRDLPLVPRIVIAGAIADSVALIWLIVVLFTPFTFWQWLQSYCVLLAVTWLLLALADVRMPAAAVCGMGIAWLAAPVWLSQAMLGAHGDAIASFITRFHPIFALNRVMSEQGAWTHLPVAYSSLTNLGQDVAYTLPESVWPCVLLHGLMAVLLQVAWAAGMRAVRC